MPSDAVSRALRDMARNIDLATEFTRTLDRDAFDADQRTVYAVTRCLEIISEASRRLPNDLKARYPEIAWNEMAAAGNVFRHDYEDVAASDVWVTVHDHLPLLRAMIDQELADPRQ